MAELMLIAQRAQTACQAAHTETAIVDRMPTRGHLPRSNLGKQRTNWQETTLEPIHPLALSVLPVPVFRDSLSLFAVQEFRSVDCST
jgi:hypothetical protein